MTTLKMLIEEQLEAEKSCTFRKCRAIDLGYQEEEISLGKEHYFLEGELSKEFAQIFDINPGLGLTLIIGTGGIL